jgi:hypothetical protein
MPSASLHVPVMAETADVAAARQALVAFHDELPASSLFKKWQQANPNEAAHLEAYWLNRSMRPIIATAFGIAYRSAIDAYHDLGV